MWLLTPLSANFSVVNLATFMRINVVQSNEFPDWWDLRGYVELSDNDDEEGVFIHRGTRKEMKKLMLVLGAGQMISPKYAPTTTTFH